MPGSQGFLSWGLGVRRYIRIWRLPQKILTWSNIVSARFMALRLKPILRAHGIKKIFVSGVSSVAVVQAA